MSALFVNMKKIKNLIVFDLGALLVSAGSVIDTGMAGQLNKLLELTKVAIISDSDWPVFETRLLPGLPQKQYLRNLVILPVNGSRYYQYRSGWAEVHPEDLAVAEQDKIKKDLLKVLGPLGINAGKVLGEQFEFKGNDIIFSALGKQAPANAKQAFDPGEAKRKKMKAALDEELFNFSARIEGDDSIVISKTGIDKAHGIYRLHQIMGAKTRKMIFISNTLFKGGNDESALTTGVACIAVNDIEETKKVIETIIVCLNMENKKTDNGI